MFHAVCLKFNSSCLFYFKNVGSSYLEEKTVIFDDQSMYYPFNQIKNQIEGKKTDFHFLRKSWCSIPVCLFEENIEYLLKC